MNCRHCIVTLEHTFLDLGFAPPSNAYLSSDDLAKPETWYPLKVMVCEQCWLVQTEDYAQCDELFNSDYAYFSSTSTGWLAHADNYVEKMTFQLQLTHNSFVIEVASNDGYLLKNFVAAGIPCLGVEPTASTAEAAERLGIPVMQKFFGSHLAKQLVDTGHQADLIVGNNVYAHVPNINDFTLGLKTVLKPGGTITLEFPHLMQLIEHCQFDTVYHEHFSYLSLYTVNRIFKSMGLRVYDVEELSTHGGSLRIYGCHDNDRRETTSMVLDLLNKEENMGLQTKEPYEGFQSKADQIKDELLSFLIEKKREGKKVAAYGAAAKGNTLLNYAGIKTDLLLFVCDASTAKQGKYLPGSHVPIVDETLLRRHKPEYIVILPWNLTAEVI